MLVLVSWLAQVWLQARSSQRPLVCAQQVLTRNAPALYQLMASAQGLAAVLGCGYKSTTELPQQLVQQPREQLHRVKSAGTRQCPSGGGGEGTGL